MKFLKSAFKHGFSGEDIARVWSRPRWSFIREDDPLTVLVLGYDSRARLLEVIGFENDQGEWVIFHAMKARKHYIERVPKQALR